MAASEVEYGFHTRIKFVCGKCQHQFKVMIRKGVIEPQTQTPETGSPA